MKTPRDGGYSSTVDIQLQVGDDILSVAQVGGNSLILTEPRDLPPSTAARLILTVDDRQRQYDIVLYEGVRDGATEVKYF